MYHIAESIRIAEETHSAIQNQIDDNSIVEFEIRCLVDPRTRTDNVRNSNFIKPVREFVKLYMDQLKCEIEQTINFIHVNQNIKQLCFIGGIQDKTKRRIYKKVPITNKLLLVSRHSVSYKICVSKETDISEKELLGEYECARFKTRLSMWVGIWRVDVTLVKEMTTREMSDLKRARDIMFSINNPDEFLGSSVWDYADRVEFELECVNLSELKAKHLKIIDEIFAGEKTTLTNIASMLGSNAKDFKSLLPKPVEIHRKQYFDLLHGQIDNFYVTDKADGIRCLICIRGLEVECITATSVHKYKTSESHTELFIFDAEWINQDSKLEPSTSPTSPTSPQEIPRDEFHIFDVLVFDGEVVAGIPFEKRLQLIKTYSYLSVKKFHDLSEGRHIINTVFDEIPLKPYKTDGLIFTSRDAPYISTLHYKWKPPEKTTIDFIAKKCPRNIIGIDPYVAQDGKQLYLLFSEINFIEAKKLRLRLKRNVSKCFSDGEGSRKCLFNPSDNEKASHVLYSDNFELDGKIVELSWKKTGWKLSRVRHDRKWANYYRVADMIWRNIHNPITKRDLLSDDPPDSYFSIKPPAMYDVSRKLCNFAKQAIISRELEAARDPVVIDLGCGNAQDIGKYLSHGFIKNNNRYYGVNQIYMMDSDPLAINEAIDRKYNYVGNRKKRFMTKIAIKQLDLTANYKDTLYVLNNALYMQRASNIFCNFALHYLIYNRESAINIGMLISSLIRTGGTFSYVSFDGELVFQALKGVKSGKSLDWIDDGKEYDQDKPPVMFSIKKNYPSTHKSVGYGKKIGVLLPFKNEYHDEYLLPKSIDSAFKKCGLAKISENYVTDFVVGFKRRNQGLTKNNLDYCRLMKCVTYKKIGKTRQEKVR